MVTVFQAIVLRFNLTHLESEFFFASAKHYSANYLPQKRFFLLKRQFQLNTSKHSVFKIVAL